MVPLKQTMNARMNLTQFHRTFLTTAPKPSFTQAFLKTTIHYITSAITPMPKNTKKNLNLRLIPKLFHFKYTIIPQIVNINQ